MKIPLFASLALALGLLACTGYAATDPKIQSLGNNTYSVTREASTGFSRDVDKLKELALEDATAYCAKLNKELKVISNTGSRPKILLTGYAKATVVFKALDASDPELHAPVSTSASGPALAPTPAAYAASPAVIEPPALRTPTDSLYNDLMKLDDLRKRGILTDEEFQAQKKKLLEKSN